MKIILDLLLLSQLGAYAAAHHPQNYRSRHFTVGQTVRTTSGRVKGHAATWPGNEAVSEYLGIPYATPPLGSLRFAPPTRFKPKKSVFDASAFSDDCIQFIGTGSTTLASPALLAYGAAMGGGTPEHPHTYSENCLSINVWTKPQTGERKKAVMVWIYGGGKLSLSLGILTPSC